MNDIKYKWILYTIVIVILSTISIQVYWNYKSYLINKQQLVNDVQVSLDNAVDSYYTNLAKNSTFSFALNSKYDESKGLDSIFETLKTDTIQKIDSIKVNSVRNIKIITGIKTDSLLNYQTIQKKWPSDSSKNIAINELKFKDNIQLLTSKVVLSISNDSIRLKTIDSLLVNELQRKNLKMDYGLSYNLDFSSENIVKKIQYLNKNYIEKSVLNTTSKSSLLPKNGTLTIHFSNETKVILKRILSGILISTLLILAVISSLFYLLRIIKHQKQLAEVKNDFISNITHEFKTPIATIGVALESIKDFNVIDNKEKTKTYLNLSNQQLDKLNMMVEKLLETAILDSKKLSLNKDDTNITDLLNLLISKHQMQAESKLISFVNSPEACIVKIDSFHFENALNNILDNAIKYGGDTIKVDLIQTSISFTISISDNGTTLTKADKEHIFKKFYRIPKGNTHDIKGFGIGLYYAKKIIEKHDGVIDLSLENSQTTFKISMPND